MALAQTEPIVAEESERNGLEVFERAFGEPGRKGRARIVGPDDRSIELPESLYRVLVRAAHELRRGRAVSIVPVGVELTTKQAADLLNVSRPFLIRLLEAGEIPYHMVGTHRRVRLDHLLTYKSRRNTGRRDFLTRAASKAQELGIYDE